MGLAFDLIYLLVAAVTYPAWSQKARGGWAERFGRIDPLPPPPPGRPRLLLHAVSVGELNAIRPLVAELATDVDLVISTTTDTGIERARTLFGDAHHVVRYPLDATFAVRRFLDAVHPHAVALAELELWPNFVRAARARSIPVCIVNGRLSGRSFPRYRRFRIAIGSLFRSLRFAAAQDETYAVRFTAMGTPRVEVAGSMKWDAARSRDDLPLSETDELATALAIDRTRPVIVAGSTTPDEHDLLAAAVPPDVQLIVAPRQPAWFDHAAETFGPDAIRRSQPHTPHAHHAERAPTRFILDTLGELETAYALADLAIVGRSFGDLFGSDPIQPAAMGVPVLIGPAHANFDQPVRALRDAGGLRVVAPDELASAAHDLIANEHTQHDMSSACLRCVAAHRGAAARQAALIQDMLRDAAP
ncbi:MAG: glycosyltransferase N-terminal domain-containing protein [Planctomycetota bacterium]